MWKFSRPKVDNPIMKASTNLEVNLMSTLSGNVRKLLDQSEPWQRQEFIKHDQNLIMESLTMNTSTKFEVNVMSGLDGNVWKLLKQAEAREGQEFGGNCVGNLPKCDAKKNTWTTKQCHSYVPLWFCWQQTKICQCLTWYLNAPRFLIVWYHWQE